MRVYMDRSAATLAALLFVAGCSASPAPSVPPVQPAQNVSRAASSAPNVAFTITVPPPAAHFVSPGTRSIIIAANHKKIGTFATSAGPHTFFATVPAGNVAFAVSAYSGAGGTGTVLGTATFDQTISKTTISVIPLALNGIVASIKVSLAQPAPPAGTATSTQVFVRAFDPSGATILGPENYAVPIALTNGDTTKHAKLSTATALSPATPIALSYDGGPLGTATIGASAKGVAPSKVTAATFAPKPTVTGLFAMPSSLSLANPVSIVTGPDGNLWIGFEEGSGMTGIVRLSPGGTTTAFLGGQGGLSMDSYYGIAAGSDHNLWFTENAGKKIGRITPSGTITEFSAGTTICPNRIIAASPSDGGLWFDSNCSNSIGHITTAGAVVATPLNLVTDKEFEGMLLGKDGNLYIVDRDGQAILQVQVGNGGSVNGIAKRPIAQGSDPSQALTGIAQTGDGALWYTNNTCGFNQVGSLAIASTFSASVVKPYVIPLCEEPQYIATAPATGGQVLWIAQFDGPFFAELKVPPGGGTPSASTITSRLPNPKNLTQTSLDITVGPDGNLWSTNDTVPGSVTKISI